MILSSDLISGTGYQLALQIDKVWKVKLDKFLGVETV